MATDDDHTQKKSPLIEELQWGFTKAKGFPSGKDLRLFPGGAEEWDWRQTETRHIPGIQPADVEYLIKKGAKYIVLSRGMENRLETSKETKDLLNKYNMTSDVDYFIVTTKEALKIYNQLVEESKPVGALIHSTC